jgi:hypothetical protein
MKTILQVVIFFISILQLNSVVAQVLLPPRNIEVNPVSLIATWQPPASVLLNEDFESSVFPPSGWQTQSEGQGWFVSDDGGSSGFQIPPHTRYAVANDDTAGSNNNGIYDFLITPLLDLSNFPGYVMSFNSFYTGQYEQMAFVEFSLDNGITWYDFYTLTPATNWKKVSINLSGFSGYSNYSSVKFRFHAEADDWGSGWAVDDVIIRSDMMDVLDYQFFVGDSLILSTNELTGVVPAALASYGDSVTVGVAAEYIQGLSSLDSIKFLSQYLIPPSGLTATSEGNQVHLTWNPPSDSILGNLPGNLQLYNIYINDQLISSIDKTSSEVWITSASPGNICYKISAVYDLTPYGYAGQVGESIKEGPACVLVHFGFELPFTEDWSAGQFMQGKWTAEENWIIDEYNGNPSPAAKFSSLPAIINYEKSLESYWLDGTTLTTTPFVICLDYDISLGVLQPTGFEELSTEIWNGSEWIVLKQYDNAVSLEFIHEQIELKASSNTSVFKIRFRASGINSSDIAGWIIDNIKVYYQFQFYPPEDLIAERTGVSLNYTQLSWQPPLTGELTSFILDDNTYEDQVSYAVPGEGWLGNEFSCSEAGILKTASVYFLEYGWATYSIDIFDGNQNLIASSGNFIPVFGDWTNIPLPDVPFSGTFYVMVHEIVPIQADYIAVDNNGPSASSNPAWFFDGLVWSKLSEFGLWPSVFFVRATGYLGDSKTFVNFKPETRIPDHPLKYEKRHAVNVQLESNKMAGKAKNNDKLAKAASNIVQFDIYRREIGLVYPWLSYDTTDWIKIDSTAETQYLDHRNNLILLGNMLNEYYVNAVYNEGVSEPSNIASEMFYEAIDDNVAIKVKIYPNPASDFLSIELGEKVETISIFNSIGTKESEVPLNGGLILGIDVSVYSPGIYSLKFTTANGESFSRKFIKM